MSIHELEAALKAGKLSRREILRAAAIMGTGLAASPLMMRTARAQPQSGGTFRIGLGHGQTTDVLDPGTYENDFTINLSHTRSNFLTEIGPDGGLRAELAESWEASPDATVWTFRLRSGVTFHNGKTIDSTDVMESINHHRGEDSTSAAKPLVDPITEITVDGPETVVFTLENGDANFPFIISDYHLAIFPFIDGALDFTVGSGAYVMNEFEPGIRASLTRNPDYWKPDAAYFDGIELLSITDTTARMNALMTGEVDLIDKVELSTIPLMQRNPTVRIIETSGTLHYTFAMDTRAEPFNDVNVRLALKYGIDRNQLVDRVLSGHGVVGNDHPIGRNQRYFAAELEQREYDPDRARFHLNEAGLDSLTVPLSVAEAAFAGATDAGVLYQESAAAAGITIDLQRVPNDGYWSNVWMNDPFCAVYWGGRPTEDWMFATAYAAGAPWNDSFWEHDRFNELLLAARSELDEALRGEMYAEMQTIVSDEGGVVIPMFANYVFAVNQSVQTPETLAANWSMDGHRACERWWFGA